MKTILLTGSLRSPPPYPAAPDFPLCRGQNKALRNTLFISGSTLSTNYSAPACGGKVVAPATKGGISIARRAVSLFTHGRKPGCKGFRCLRQRHIKLPSEPARSVGRTHRSVRSTRTIEPGRRKAPEPSSPSGLVHKACQPSGILESTAPVPIPTAAAGPLDIINPLFL